MFNVLRYMQTSLKIPVVAQYTVESVPATRRFSLCPYLELIGHSCASESLKFECPSYHTLKTFHEPHADFTLHIYLRKQRNFIRHCSVLRMLMPFPKQESEVGLVSYFWELFAGSQLHSMSTLFRHGMYCESKRRTNRIFDFRDQALHAS